MLSSIFYALRHYKKEPIMGCDIHTYAEYRKDGQWHAEEAASIGTNDRWGDIQEVIARSGDHGRDYELFGLLAGVRRDNQHGWEPQGIPEDISKEVKDVIADWDGDGHSHSYLTFQQLKEKAAVLLLYSDTEARESSGMLAEWIKSFGPNPEDVANSDRRVVFFFDN